MTGVRELSLISTPPVDRLAVRTFVSPFDPLVIRETLLRERYRGGQSFYVCPRISDLAEVKAFLRRARAGAEGRRRARPDGRRASSMTS
jgi:transcription-repair coupling factor (superfamily II helicase)